MAKPVILRFIGDTKALQASFAAAGASSTTFGKKVALGAAAAGAGLVAAGVAGGFAAFKLGEKFKASYNTIRIGTGATGAKLEGLKQTFKDVVRDVPTDFGTAADAVADLNTRTGATGDALRNLATAEIRLSRLTKTDLKENVASTTRLFGDWSIKTEDQTGALDKLFRASQATGIGVTDLTQKVVFFGSPLRQLGFSLDEGVALLSKWEKEGVNVETVLGGMRQSIGRLAAPTDQFLGTLEKFDLADAFQKAPDVASRFQLVKGKILELFAAGDKKSKLEAADLALQAFGRRAGSDVVAAFGEGRFALGKLLDTVANGKETIQSAADDVGTFGGKWTRIKNTVLVGLEPLAMGVFDAVTRAAEHLLEGIQGLGPFFDQFAVGFRALRSAFSGEGVTSDGFVGAMERIGVAMRQVVDSARRVWPKVRETIGSVMESVKTIVLSVLTIVGTLWEALGPTILGVFEAVYPIILKVNDVVFSAVSKFAAFSAVLSRNKGAVKAIATVLGVLLIPHIIKAGVVSTVSAAKQVAAWVATKAQAVAGAATSTASLFAMGAKWVWAGLQATISAAKMAAAWIASLGPVAWVVAGVAVAAALIIANWDKIVRFVKKVPGWIAGAFKGAGSFIWGKIKGVFHFIKERIEDVVGAYVTLYVRLPLRIVRALAGFGSKVWNGVKAGFSFVTDKISGQVTRIVEFYTGLPGRILRGLGKMKDAGLRLGRGFLDSLKNGLTAVAGFAGDVAGAIVRAVKDGWNVVARKINDFVPNKIGWGRFSLDLPDNPIPTFAAGGIVSQPTLAWIGEAGAEAIVPLTRPGRAREVMEEAGLVGARSGSTLSRTRQSGGVHQTIYQTITALDPREASKIAAREHAWAARTAGW